MVEWLVEAAYSARAVVLKSSNKSDLQPRREYWLNA